GTGVQTCALPIYRYASTATTGSTILPTRSCCLSVVLFFATAYTSRVNMDESVSMMESIVDTAAAMMPIMTMMPRTGGTISDDSSLGVAKSPFSRPGNLMVAANPHVTATSV